MGQESCRRFIEFTRFEYVRVVRSIVYPSYELSTTSCHSPPPKNQIQLYPAKETHCPSHRPSFVIRIKHLANQPTTTKPMAAPSIPNLSTLRSTRGSKFGRGRGRDVLEAGTIDTAEDRAWKDRVVQQTDQDASISRMSAVDVGYLDDPFAKYFAEEPCRRFPIINRGQISLLLILSVDRLQDDQAPLFAQQQSIPW